VTARIPLSVRGPVESACGQGSCWRDEPAALGDAPENADGVPGSCITVVVTNRTDGGEAKRCRRIVAARLVILCQMKECLPEVQPS
jgi:hypothetical protein